MYKQRCKPTSFSAAAAKNLLGNRRRRRLENFNFFLSVSGGGSAARLTPLCIKRVRNEEQRPLYVLATFQPKILYAIRNNNFLYLLFIKRSVALTKIPEDALSSFLTIVSLFYQYFYFVPSDLTVCYMKIVFDLYALLFHHL